MSVIPDDARRCVPDRPRLLSLPNGEKATPTFSREEMDRRLSKLRSWMREASVDACLLTSIHNVNYFADYVYCSFGRHYGLVVTHDAHTIIGANLDYGRPWRRSFADSIAYTDWRRDNFFVAVRSLCPDRGRIGVELDHLTCAARAKLAAALPDAELVDAGEPTMRMRMIKSVEEQALIRIGAAIADIGGAAAVEAIAEAVPEHEVALHATTAMTRETTEISELDWVLPEQGGVRWSQSIGVFVSSTKPDLALEFVKYILSPEGQARLATSSCYWAMPANAKAAAHLTEQQRWALRWDDQPGYLARSQLYPAPSAELDAKMQDVWTEFMQH